ncbi:HlyD family efflux transporter periplasmic adaptor subunit [Bacillus lacus]|uniref:HlyD family efflux transporter periplasmic adaptor subunit n=1 Tax=Metabacillus lacus TaxID=1983721 RepID=A0A7X2LYB5_9BACI|nr:efflux RND transporter periplasmic adaptor subunit [Metabacillus lacus]MRX71618.1 HlyD family efflux transporter periplasmic adaptor subunit [Metabacillus lacus]
MKKILISLGLAAIIGTLIGINVYKAYNPDEYIVQTGTLQENEVAGTILLPATLSFAQEQFIFANPEKGRIAEILVSVGDTVTAGTEIVRYESEQLNLEAEQNRLALQSNDLRIQQIQNQLSTLDDKEDDLALQVGGSQAEEQIEAERNSLELELNLAEIEREQTELQRQTIDRHLSELVVTSEFDGQIVSVDRTAVSGNSQGTPAVHIGSGNQLVVKGQLSEYDSTKVLPGQPVSLRSDALPDMKLEGSVSTIGIIPVSAETAGMPADPNAAVQYPIEAAVTSEEITAKPGFRLIMEIETERRTAQTVPQSAIRKVDSKDMIYIVEEGKAVAKVVELGLSAEEYIEVTKGLTAEDLIVLNPGDDLKAGMEVTAND